MLSLVFAFPLALLAQESVPAPDISARNYLRVDKDFCTAGQPSPEDLQRLKQQGIRSILNLRRPEEDPEGQAQERKSAEELGFRYFSIPVDGANPNAGDVEKFQKIVNDGQNRPVFIHCHSANRVGAFWLIHRVVDDGWDCEKAEKEARQIGLSRPNLVEFAKNYIRERKPDACTEK